VIKEGKEKNSFRGLLNGQRVKSPEKEFDPESDFQLEAWNRKV